MSWNYFQHDPHLLPQTSPWTELGLWHQSVFLYVLLLTWSTHCVGMSMSDILVQVLPPRPVLSLANILIPCKVREMSLISSTVTWIFLKARIWIRSRSLRSFSPSLLNNCTNARSPLLSLDSQWKILSTLTKCWIKNVEGAQNPSLLLHWNHSKQGYVCLWKWA